MVTPIKKRYFSGSKNNVSLLTLLYQRHFPPPVSTGSGSRNPKVITLISAFNKGTSSGYILISFEVIADSVY